VGRIASADTQSDSGTSWGKLRQLDANVALEDIPQFHRESTSPNKASIVVPGRHFTDGHIEGSGQRQGFSTIRIVLTD